MSRYKYPRMTLTQIGEMFGATSHEVGKWLVHAGLRDAGKRPTQAAFGGDYCEAAPSNNNCYSYAWRPEKVVPVLERLGHPLLRLLPIGLVEPPPFAGPFAVRTDAAGLSEVVNADGSLAALVPGRREADRLSAVMNAAHKLGYLGVTSPPA